MSETLLTLFPTADDLLAMPPDDLAPILLKLAAGSGRMFWPDAVSEIKQGTGMATSIEFAYPYHKKPRIDVLLGETWELLRREGLIMPAPDQNGRNGYMVLTKEGVAISSKEDFARFRAARAFPKSLLHPAIADKVYSSLMRGELDEAVFAAFKAVEVAVREAGKYSNTDIGMPLMRKAFDAKGGPLTDLSQTEAEREALAHLFAGAIGSYKNPHSHRTVALTDPREAQQQVMLATHLLSIIEARRKNP
ncbi:MULTISPECIES: TIGR02391 family protein [unclassified Bradyrhizobium]|uniref:TIGR02391 family protein n=1 Tax=unclassified Bradyrhizobium TaxID=2631580 RepID=UPI0029160087|nr:MULTISPECIES: TIGR02391 family protein [unclassified Bradyrhizobium]